MFRGSQNVIDHNTISHTHSYHRAQYLNDKLNYLAYSFIAQFCMGLIPVEEFTQITSRPTVISIQLCHESNLLLTTVQLFLWWVSLLHFSLQAATILRISDYVKKHPKASEAQLKAAVEKEIKNFAEEVAKL